MGAMVMTSDARIEALADSIVRDVAELERTSPDSDPEMMLVTPAELHGVVIARLAAADAAAAGRASEIVRELKNSAAFDINPGLILEAASAIEALPQPSDDL